MKKVILGILVVTVFTMISISQVWAQEEEFGPSAGDVSFVPQISFQQTSPDQGDDTQTLFATTGLGYYITQQLELSGVVFISGNGESFTDFWSLGLMPTLYYDMAYSGHQRVVPHLGAGAGVVRFESTEDDFDVSETGYQYSAIVGLDWWVVDDGAVRMDLKYIHNSFNDFDSDVIGIFIGANLIFD